MVFKPSRPPSCAIRGSAAKMKFRPTDGMEVIAEGRVDVYESRGQLQLYVERMPPKGAGALELAFQQLREKLQTEGLFDAAGGIGPDSKKFLLGWMDHYVAWVKKHAS